MTILNACTKKSGNLLKVPRNSLYNLNVDFIVLCLYLFRGISMCAVSVTFTLRFNSVWGFLFFSIQRLHYCIRVLLTWFPIYLLVYFWYFLVRKPTFLYYHLSVVSESLACLKSSAFFPNFYDSFFILFLYTVAPKITVKSKFVVVPSPFTALVSLIWVVA